MAALSCWGRLRSASQAVVFTGMCKTKSDFPRVSWAFGWDPSVHLLGVFLRIRLVHMMFVLSEHTLRNRNGTLSCLTGPCFGREGALEEGVWISELLTG